jgi:hypothetical protein
MNSLPFCIDLRMAGLGARESYTLLRTRQTIICHLGTRLRQPWIYSQSPGAGRACHFAAVLRWNGCAGVLRRRHHGLTHDVRLVIDAERIEEALGRTEPELAALERYLTRDSAAARSTIANRMGTLCERSWRCSSTVATKCWESSTATALRWRFVSGGRDPALEERHRGQHQDEARSHPFSRTSERDARISGL